MRSPRLLAFTLVAACGSNHSGTKSDAAGKLDTTSGSPTTITLTLTNHPSNAAMFSFVVAYQDGAGAWTVAPPPTGDVYTFTVNAAAYGVAWTCVDAASNRTVDILYFAVAERTSITAVVPFACTDVAPPMAVGLSGTITNGTANTTYHVSFGLRSENPPPRIPNAATSVAYAMETPPSTHDLIAGNDTLAGGVATTDVLIGTSVIQRALAVTTNTTGHTIDLTGAGISTAAVTNVPPNGGNTRATVSTELVSKNGTAFVFVRQAAGAGTTLVTRGLASAAADPADVYNQQVRLDDIGTGSTTVSQNWVTTIAPLSYTAPSNLGGAISTVTGTTPYPIIKTTWAVYANAVGYAWSAQQATATGGCVTNANCVTWTAGISPGSVGSSPQFVMPDLSHLTGWDARLQPTTGTAVGGLVTAITSSVGANDFPTFATPPAGTTRTIAASGWAVTP
jgi:hypothetical protein